MLFVVRFYLLKDLKVYIEIFNFEIRIYVGGSIINIANKNIASKLNRLAL